MPIDRVQPVYDMRKPWSVHAPRNAAAWAGALALALALAAGPLSARIIPADPGTYTGVLPGLQPGDTLLLAPGIYENNLAVRNLVGRASDPIVIMGSAPLYATVFVAQPCCNTVSITQCAYLVIKDLELDGRNIAVDAVKGEGTAGNWAHHITIENLNIIGYGSDQQNVGISTKCHAWNWTIRRNRIAGAGTGLYLGNSDGDKPFVNGLIEYNLVTDPVGYCMEIKHQSAHVRDAFPGTAVDGRTVIRHNVFSKDRNASTGADARPNVLLGAFPPDGPGTNDVYDVYGNFFYQNPVEALLQATGNLALYANVFVNHADPPGMRAVYVTSQNGFLPRDIRIFRNTVWTANSSGGIRLSNPDRSFRQSCDANAVFGPRPITNFTDTSGNVTDAYAAATLYVQSASADLAALDLYPRCGRLDGAPVSDSLFAPSTEADLDFNGDRYDARYRGAYSGCGMNPGWRLQLDTMTLGEHGTSAVRPAVPVSALEVFPNPASEIITVQTGGPGERRLLRAFDVLGREVARMLTGDAAGAVRLDVSGWTPGTYTLVIADGRMLKRAVVTISRGESAPR